MAEDDWKLETVAAQALHRLDTETGGVIAPWQPATTFARRAQDYQPTAGLVYGRADNPTVKLAEDVIARLEGGKECLLFASGLAAIASLFRSLPPSHGGCLGQ